MQTEKHLNDLPDVLTVPEAARFFRVARKTMYDAIRLGRIPAYRFGRAIRVSKQKLAELLAKGQLEGGEQTNAGDRS